jgi:tetratricopeptide (TPR) repeat protein
MFFSTTNPSLYSFLLSPSRGNVITKPNLLSFPSLTRVRNPITVFVSSNSIASSYSGWDDLAIAEPLSQTDAVDPIQDLLLSIGVRNGKTAVLFIFGLLSALAVSRVRFSPFTFLPVSVLVFLAGFAVGIAREGVGSRIEKSKISDEKSKVLRAIISELEEKLGELRNGLQTIGGSGRLEGVKIRKSIDITDYIKTSLANASKVIEKDLNFNDIIEGEKKLNSKPAQKRAILEAVASDVVKYFGSLIEENMGELGPTRKKVESNKDKLSGEVNLKREDNLLSKSRKVEESKNTSMRDLLDDGKLEPAYSNMHLYNQEIKDLNSSRLERTVLKHIKGSSQKTGLTKESKGSSVLEQTLEIHNRSFKFKFEEIGERNLTEENFEIQDQTDCNSNSSDDEFNRNLKEASDILARARECLKINSDEEKADALLYKASSLLSTAVSLKPSSLSAIGQLGNTCLLHGELKLKISRQLRGLLVNRDGSRFKKAEFGSGLAEVCEECENLLVEAGRNYRKALTIDANDAKALYNWGLALSFRAQLLSDIGPVSCSKLLLCTISSIVTTISVLSSCCSFFWQSHQLM